MSLSDTDLYPIYFDNEDDVSMSVDLSRALVQNKFSVTTDHISVQFSVDMNGSQSINPNASGNPLTFPQVLPQ